MTNKIQAAYILGQNAAMQKHASGAIMMAAPAGVMQGYAGDRGGLTYNPRYSQRDIDAIRRYNRDVASGDSNVTGAAAAAAIPLAAGGAFLNNRLASQNLARMMSGSMVDLTKAQSFMQSANKGQLLRGAAKDVGRMAMRHPGKLGLGMAAAFGLGKGLRYMGKRFGQGIDNYVHTDVNSQDRR